MAVLIVGAGEMGRWFGAAVDDDVAFADVDPRAAADAAADGRGRAVDLETSERFELVCVAVPLPDAASAIETHAPRATAAIVDVTGSMGEPLDAMRRHASDLEYASLHPLFSPANAPGRIAIVDDAAGPTIDRVLETLEERGNSLVETTALEHDRAMETVQARAHAAVLAFGLAAEAVPERFGTPVYDGLEALLEEVTGSSPRVYADIQEAFDGAEDVAEAARQIAESDRETFERLFDDAGR